MMASHAHPNVNLKGQYPLPQTQDACSLNAVANAPDVRPHLGCGDAPLDFGPALASGQVLAFADERGGFLCEDQGAGRFELHTLLAPQARGAEALRLCAGVLRRLFVATNCIEVVTRVPANLRAADLMARRAGFREVWTMGGVWPGAEGPEALRLFAMTLDEWMMRDPTLKAEGDAFHDLLTDAARAAGDDSPALHPHEDEVHDRAAGMAALMANAGNHIKAVWSYGRWARLAGYGPLNLISERPAIYETGGTTIRAHNGALEVLEWSPRQ